ncbi:MAG: O-antigen ligase family protein [Pelosinus sp.]|nr:O-antigen ligase family protein [Pelosinus sp.]
MLKIEKMERAIPSVEFFLEHCLLAVAFFLPLSPNMTMIFLTLTAVLWLAKILITRKIAIIKTPFDKWVGLFSVCTALSIQVSPDPGFSYYNFYHSFCLYIFLYYAVLYNIHSKKQIKRMLWATLAAAFLVTFYGFYQYIHGMDITAMDWVDGEQFPEITVRVFSTLKNPNLLAGYLVTIISLAIGFGCKARSRKRRAIFLALTVIFGTCLVLTYSRGAWISLLFVAGAYGLYYNRKVFWLMLPLVGILLFLHNGFYERILSIANPTDSSAAMRMALWQSTLAMIAEKPLLGIGWGAYWMVYPKYDFFLNDPNTTIFHAHNMYLNIAAEVGTPGLLAFLAVLYSHSKACLTVIKNKRNRWSVGLALGILFALIGTMVNGLTDFIMFSNQLALLFWLLNGLVAVLWVHQTEVKCDAVQSSV